MLSQKDAVGHLQTIPFAQAQVLITQPLSSLSIESPAISFMTDFHNVRPVTVDVGTNVNEALLVMKRSFARILLVTEHDKPAFCGIVGDADLSGAKVLAYMAKNQLHDRDAVLVSNVMTSKQHIHGLDHKVVMASSIGDILQTLKHHGEQHLMVIDMSDGSISLRGMFSVSTITKALHMHFDIEPTAKTFFDLEQVILHHQIIV